MSRSPLPLVLLAAVLACAPLATASVWPANSTCERPVDEAGLVVQVCVGGSICYAVGGQTHVFVCVDPSFCPPPADDGSLPSAACRSAGAQDADGDGWSVEAGDCNDNDPMTHPGADEHPDGMDNDCDGEVDEGR